MRRAATRAPPRISVKVAVGASKLTKKRQRLSLALAAEAESSDDDDVFSHPWSKERATKKTKTRRSTTSSSSDDDDIFDRLPRNGRFSDELNDDDDRACVPIPLVKNTPELIREAEDGALERVRARMGRLGMHQPAEKEEMEEEKEVTQKKKLDINVSCDSLYARMLALAERDLEDAQERMQVNTRKSLSCDLLRDIKRVAGDITLDGIRRTLNSFGLVPSESQRLFTHNFIQACLPM